MSVVILMHSSKTMRVPATASKPTGKPALLGRAEELIGYLRTLSSAQVANVMTVSAELADRTREQYAQWSPKPADQAPAAECFVGDIYSGLQVDTWKAADRTYADRHLRILSGLYGILRPFDGISPYRLEMGYRLPRGPYANLYTFWGTSIVEQLPADGPIVNLSAVEYGKTVTKHVARERLVTPKFLTVDAKSKAPKFVTVHAKIARGAFARWLVTERRKDLREFADIGYAYDEKGSTPAEPVFVAREFGGKGLSVRLT